MKEVWQFTLFLGCLAINLITTWFCKLKHFLSSISLLMVMSPFTYGNQTPLGLATIAFFAVLSAAFLALPIFKVFGTAVQMPPIPNDASRVFLNVTFSNGSVGHLNSQLLTEAQGNTIIAAVNAIINGQLDLNDVATTVTDEGESTAADSDGGGAGRRGGSGGGTDPVLGDDDNSTRIDS
jgi:hypothetical protein